MNLTNTFILLFLFSVIQTIQINSTEVATAIPTVSPTVSPTVALSTSPTAVPSKSPTNSNGLRTNVPTVPTQQPVSPTSSTTNPPTTEVSKKPNFGLFITGLSFFLVAVLLCYLTVTNDAYACLGVGCFFIFCIIGALFTGLSYL
jgi:hypothetical protein